MLGQRVTAIGGTLASSSGRLGRLSWQALIWSAVAIAAVILLGVVVLAVRRRALNAAGRSDSSSAIDEVERLHEQGLLTDEEYRRARRVALGLPPLKAEADDADRDAPEEDV